MPLKNIKNNIRLHIGPCGTPLVIYCFLNFWIRYTYLSNKQVINESFQFNIVDSFKQIIQAKLLSGVECKRLRSIKMVLTRQALRITESKNWLNEMNALGQKPFQLSQTSFRCSKDVM